MWNPDEWTIGTVRVRGQRDTPAVRSSVSGHAEMILRARSRSFSDFVFRFARETQYVTIYLTPGRARGTINIAMMRRKREQKR